MTHTSESGRSMTEMLAVLAIIGVISIGGISGISFAMNMFRSNATQEMIETIAQNVSDLYAWDRELPTEAGDMCSRICRNKTWDTSCTKSCGGSTQATYENPFGGDLVIQENDEATFNIQVTDIPAGICEDLKNKTWATVDPQDCVGTTLTVTSR